MKRTTRLAIALSLNAVLTVAQVIAGLVAGSLGLLADAGHNLTDVAAIAGALFALRLSMRPATREHSFGYHRATILAALANAAAIMALSVFVVVEAIRRIGHPTPVDGSLVLVVAGVAVVVNGGAMLVLRDGSRELNMRANLVHMAGDAGASLAVAGAGLVILLTGRLYVLDPIASLVVAAIILVEAWKLLRQSSDILLESSPSGMNLEALTSAMRAVPGVAEVHDLHVWSLSSELHALSAHVVLAGHPSLEAAQATGDLVKTALAEPFTIAHATIELECERCVDEGEQPCAFDLLPTSGKDPGQHAHSRHG